MKRPLSERIEKLGGQHLHNMKPTKLRLTLDVDFDPQGLTADELKRNLHRVVQDATNNGTLTGDSPATVERYNFTVTERRSVKKKEKVSVESKNIIASYEGGLCPDCKWMIRKHVKEGDACHCGHVFHLPQAND